MTKKPEIWTRKRESKDALTDTGTHYNQMLPSVLIIYGDGEDDHWRVENISDVDAMRLASVPELEARITEITNLKAQADTQEEHGKSMFTLYLPGSGEASFFPNTKGNREILHMAIDGVEMKEQNKELREKLERIIGWADDVHKAAECSIKEIDDARELLAELEGGK